MAQVSRRILVVDTEPALCQIMVKFLQRWGYEAECATSHGEALDILKAKGCDLVLMDLLLPGMTGHELAPHVKQFNPNIPVALISAFPPDSVPGVDYIYNKPITPAKLRQIVENILGTGEQQRAAA